MLDLKKDVKRVKRVGTALVGITKYKVGERLVISVNTHKATFKGKPYLRLDFVERKHFDDLLYLSHVQEGNPQIVYV